MVFYSALLTLALHSLGYRIRMANQNTKVFFCMETENTQNQHPLPWTGLANSLGAPFLDFGPNNSFLSTVLLTVITVALRFSGVKYIGHIPGPELCPGHCDRALPAPGT